MKNEHGKNFYTRLTKHPGTGRWHRAKWVANTFGAGKVGVYFSGINPVDPSMVHLETKNG